MPVYIGKAHAFDQRDDQKKFYPPQDTGSCRLPVTQSSIKANIMKFSNPSKEMPDDLLLKLALRKAYYAFLLPNDVKMLHLNDVFRQDLDIWMKSPGLPWHAHGYKTMGDIKADPDAVCSVRFFWHKIKNGEKVRAPDCLAFGQSHGCDVGEKQVRTVWQYPATITFGEAVFALPLIRAYQQHTGRIAYGYETALEGAKKVCDRFDLGQHYAGLYFSKFDETIPARLVKEAFLVLEANIDFGNYEETGVPDARKMIHMYDYIVDYFTNTTIRTADGSRYKKNSGVANGSYFTELIKSVCNYILCTWISLHQFHAYPKDILVMGEDSLLSLEGPLNLEEADNLVKTIGMRLSFSKSQVTTELKTMKFLGYTLTRCTWAYFYFFVPCLFSPVTSLVLFFFW